MSDGLAAVFRPQASEIAIYLQHGGRTGYITLDIAEARQLHGTLGGALRHADAVDDPVGAVTQADLWKLRQTVAATVRGDEADAFSPLSRFARRIESGEADDSEPMRIALAVAGSGVVMQHLSDAPSGAELAAKIRREAELRGVTIGSLVAQLSPNNPTSYLAQLAIAKNPTSRTIDRVRALLAGEPVALVTRTPPVGNTTERTEYYAAKHADAKERETALQRRSFQARELRRPGEALADAVRRLGRQIDAEEAEEAEARRQAELDRLASPSALLRRALRDWPDQCGKVRAIADELGVTVAEAWHRVIKAGLDCLSDDEEPAHG